MAPTFCTAAAGCAEAFLFFCFGSEEPCPQAMRSASESSFWRFSVSKECEGALSIEEFIALSQLTMNNDIVQLNKNTIE
jgi:hypothetical protein